MELKISAPKTEGSIGWNFNHSNNRFMGDALMAKYNIGIDYHKKFSYLIVKNKDGKVLRSGQVTNSKKTVFDFLEPFKTDSSAVLESCRNWCVMHDWLEEIVDDVILANPIKVKVIAEAKIKTDKIDATVLADLLRANLIPPAYIAKRPVRDMRNLLRERIFFVRLRTMTKNRITTIFDRYPEEVRKEKAKTDLFNQISPIFRSPVKIKLLIHCHIILALPALIPPFQPHSSTTS